MATATVVLGLVTVAAGFFATLAIAAYDASSNDYSLAGLQWAQYSLEPLAVCSAALGWWWLSRLVPHDGTQARLVRRGTGALAAQWVLLGAVFACMDIYWAISFNYPSQWQIMLPYSLEAFGGFIAATGFLVLASASMPPTSTADTEAKELRWGPLEYGSWHGHEHHDLHADRRPDG